MRPFLFALLGAVLTWPLAASAVDEVPLSPGARVRVTFPCRLLTSSPTGDCKMTGRLARWEPDSLTVSTSDNTTPFALRDLSSLEVSQGQKSHRFLGAGLGAVIGAGAAYLILNSGGTTALCDQSANQDAMSSSECLGLYALGGLAGAGLGFLIGGMIHSERWQNVSPEK